MFMTILLFQVKNQIYELSTMVSKFNSFLQLVSPKTFIIPKLLEHPPSSQPNRFHGEFLIQIHMSII